MLKNLSPNPSANKTCYEYVSGGLQETCKYFLFVERDYIFGGTHRWVVACYLKPRQKPEIEIPIDIHEGEIETIVKEILDLSYALQDEEPDAAKNKLKPQYNDSYNTFGITVHLGDEFPSVVFSREIPQMIKDQLFSTSFDRKDKVAFRMNGTLHIVTEFFLKNAYEVLRTGERAYAGFHKGVFIMKKHVRNEDQKKINVKHLRKLDPDEAIYNIVTIGEGSRTMSEPTLRIASQFLMRESLTQGAGSYNALGKTVETAYAFDKVMEKQKVHMLQAMAMIKTVKDDVIPYIAPAQRPVALQL